MRVIFVAVSFGLLLTGCATKTTPGPATESPANPSAARQVTLHVKGMIERQNITGPTGRNRVSEALVGLPGITKVDVDIDKELLYITYDADKVTHEQMLDAIRTQEFQGEIVAGTSVRK